MAARVKVKQEPEKEVPTEILAESIVQIAQGVRALRKGRLNDSALFLLIQHAAPTNKNRGGGYGQRLAIKDIKAVFAGIDALEAEYLKKKPT